MISKQLCFPFSEHPKPDCYYNFGPQCFSGACGCDYHEYEYDSGMDWYFPDPEAVILAELDWKKVDKDRGFLGQRQARDECCRFSLLTLEIWDTSREIGYWGGT